MSAESPPPDRRSAASDASASSGPAWDRVDEQLRRRGAILEAVRVAAERFLDPSTSWDAELPHVLITLARATGTSRVYLFENRREDPNGEVWATQQFEWSAPGVRSIADEPALLDLPWHAAGFGRWVDHFRRGEPIYGLRNAFPAPEQRQLKADDTVSIAVVPILVDGVWWGVLGFDECAFERVWTQGEMDALRAAASVIGAAIRARRADEEVRARETEYRAVFEQTSDGLVVTDLEGHLVAANPAFCRMHGRTLDELRGRTPASWVHPDFLQRRQEYARVAAGGGTYTTEAVDVRADGTTFPVEVRGTRFMFRGQPHTLGVVRDITERLRTRQLLQRRVAALSAIAESLTVDQPLAKTLTEVCQVVVSTSDIVASAVQMLDRNTGERVLAAEYGLPDGYTDALARAWARGGASPVALAVRAQRVAWIPDAREAVRATPEYAPVHPFLDRATWSGILVVPLDALGRNLGTINFYYPPGVEPDADEQAFLRAAADQAAAAVENARLFGSAQRAAALEERQRLARDLHDSVSQALYGIALGARTARTLADQDPSRVGEPLDYVLGLAEAGLAEMRALIFELRPDALAAEGLVAALDRQLRALRARHALEVVGNLGEEPDAPLAVKEALYRVTQEALHNIVKHASATRVEVTVRNDSSGLILEIRDDGVGFDASASFPGHLGLRSMRERVEGLSGTFTVDSAPERGTRLHARVPVGA